MFCTVYTPKHFAKAVKEYMRRRKALVYKNATNEVREKIHRFQELMKGKMDEVSEEIQDLTGQIKYEVSIGNIQEAKSLTGELIAMKQSRQMYDTMHTYLKSTNRNIVTYYNMKVVTDGLVDALSELDDLIGSNEDEIQEALDSVVKASDGADSINTLMKEVTGKMKLIMQTGKQTLLEEAAFDKDTTGESLIDEELKRICGNTGHNNTAADSPAQNFANSMASNMINSKKEHTIVPDREQSPSPPDDGPSFGPPQLTYHPSSRLSYKSQRSGFRIPITN